VIFRNSFYVSWNSLCCPKFLKCYVSTQMRQRTLSVSPYGSWIMWTWSRNISPINNHHQDLEICNDSHKFNSESCDRLNHKRHILIPLSHDILLIRYLIIGINYTLFDLVTWQVLFICSMTWHPCDLVTCLQAVSMQYQLEGPEYISPSSGWTNSTLDPWSTTNTFSVPNSNFIVTLLWCDVWYHQSTLSM
jgi:hypothetical protein